MLFGHQNDAKQTQPQAADQPDPGFIGPLDQAAQTVAPQPQGPIAGVNPLAVDPATGASLPVVPADSVGPIDTSVIETDEQLSVLDQPVTYATEPESTVENHAAPVEAPMYTEDASAAYAGSPFSATPAPAQDPVMNQADENREATVIAQELDTPNEDHRAIFAQDPRATEVPAVENAPMDTQPAANANQPPNDYAPSSPAPVQSQTNDGLLELKQQAIAQLSPLISQLDQTPEEKFRTTMMMLQSTDNPAILHDAYSAAQEIPDEKVRAQALLDVVNEINYFTQQQDAQNG